MQPETGDELKEIYQLRRKGATITEFWDFILKSHPHQKVWEQHYAGGKMAIKMWRFLLASKERRESLQIWEQQNQELDTTKIPWWEIILSFPEELRKQTLAKLSMMMGSEAKESTPAIIHFLQEADEDLRREAAKAMSTLGALDATAVPFLIKALKDQNSVVREEAIWALGKIGSAAKDAVPTLIESYQVGDVSLQTQLIHTLGRIGTEAEEAIPMLINALLDENPIVRYLAAETMSKVQGLPPASS